MKHALRVLIAMSNRAAIHHAAHAFVIYGILVASMEGPSAITIFGKNTFGAARKRALQHPASSSAAMNLDHMFERLLVFWKTQTTSAAGIKAELYGQFLSFLSNANLSRHAAVAKVVAAARCASMERRRRLMFRVWNYNVPNQNDAVKITFVLWVSKVNTAV